MQNDDPHTRRGVDAPAHDIISTITPRLMSIAPFLEHLLAALISCRSWPLPWSWELEFAGAAAQAEQGWKGQFKVKIPKTPGAYGQVFIN